MNEFDLIEKYFKPLTQGHDTLEDDAALLSIPGGQELVVTSDTLNEGVHFLEGEAPENIAHKALRVNLSDLAAMGAKPLSYQLNIAFSDKPDEIWLKSFTNALLEDQKTYNIFCSGGDTTSIKGKHLSISITALGKVPEGKALRRSGAQSGDVIIVTSHIGDAYLGLKALRENLDFPQAIERYKKPQPRIHEIQGIAQYINAAADISDGFLADATHIAKASKLGMDIDISGFEFSDDVQKVLDEGLMMIEEALTGGDDYELVLAVQPENAQTVTEALKRLGCSPFIAGEFTPNALEYTLRDGEKNISIGKDAGWTHF